MFYERRFGSVSLSQHGSDPEYSVARQLLKFGDAVTQLREGTKMTRGQLGKLLHVKAQGIAVMEEETPRAPAGSLESALSVLLHTHQMCAKQTSEALDPTRTVRHSLTRSRWCAPARRILNQSTKKKQ